jgi:hypothetical protein
VNAKRDLLRHRARGHPNGGLLSQERRDPRFEVLADGALAVVVDLLDRGRALGERQEGRPRIAVARAWASDDALASRPDLCLLATFSHVESVRGTD